MPPERAALDISGLLAWTAMWWLAWRAVLGGRLGAMDWIPVGVLAFVIPLMAGDFLATRGQSEHEAMLILVWGSVGLAIDLIWFVRRIRRREPE